MLEVVHRRCPDVSRWINSLSSHDVFVCRLCLDHPCSVKEKVEFERGEDGLEDVEKFYLSDMPSLHGGAS